MRKTWKKPLHKRKVWKSVSWLGSHLYYMQPLVEHFFDVWMQPLPFPTLLKFIYSIGLLFFIALPMLYPLMVFIFYYGIFQYVCEQNFQVVFSEQFDLWGSVTELCQFEITNPKYLLFVSMYVDRYRLILTAISSTVDYMRMALSFVFN